VAYQKKVMWAPHIDGLRAIAILSIIIYHLNSAWLPGGFAGVDIFFVISGFVISASVSQLESMNLKRFMSYFYSRRLVRIKPALVLCLVVTFIASALFIPGAWLSNANEKTGLFAFWGLSNFVLVKTANDYFSPVTAFNPFTHTWALAIEEQFYLIFPLFFYAWLRDKRLRALSLFAGTTAVSVLCAWLLGKHHMQAFYMIWSRFWELSTGVLLFQVMSLRGHSFIEPSGESKISTIGAFLSFITLTIGLILARPGAAPVPACVLPVVGTLGLIGFLHGRSTGVVYAALTNKLLRFLGKISYSLYLWHWPVFVLFRWTVGLDSWLSKIAATSLMMVLAIISYYYVEVPPRQMTSRFPRAGLAAALALIVVGYWGSTVIAAKQSSISLSTVTKNPAVWYPGTIRPSAAYPNCRVDVKPTILKGVGNCMILRRVGGTQPVTFRHQVFVIGDSHAGAYFTMLGQFVLATGSEVYLYSNGGEPFISFKPKTQNDQDAKYVASSVDDVLPRIRPGDIIFLASLRLPYLVGQYAHFQTVDKAKIGMLSPAAREGRRQGESSAIPILRKFTQKGAKVVFEAPTPMFETVPFRCSDWFNRSNPICKYGDSIARSTLDELRKPVLKSFERMEAVVPNVYVWDPLPVLCPSDICKTYLDGNPIVFDGDHISGYANDILLPSFSQFVMKVEDH
jgi:peptidoglycan/LPS O-acetylase OafA/YrhL